MSQTMIQIRGFLIMVTAVATAVVAIGAAAVFVGDLLPYAKRSDFNTLTVKVAELDVRGLTFYVESLTRQIYAARQACKRGDLDACDFARDLEKQIEAARAKLRQARGF